MPIPALQGTINRLRGSVVFDIDPELTVTAPYLGRGGIVLSWGGSAAQQLPTMTGTVQSPEPYIMADVSIHILRSQALADLFKARMELDTNLGSINVIGDAATLSSWQIENCVFTGIESLSFDGNNAEFIVKVQGVYYINASLWADS